MRSGAANGQDVLTDKAIIYSLNVTNIGSEAEKKSYGGADSCRPCPSFNGNTGTCEACPPGNFIDIKVKIIDNSSVQGVPTSFRFFQFLSTDNFRTLYIAKNGKFSKI